MLAMKALSCFLIWAKGGWGVGFLLGFKVRGRRGEGVKVSHVLFSDDTTIFCEASQD